MILNWAVWHKASALKIPENMRLVSRASPYSPEFYPLKHLWDELRKKASGNIVFKSLSALEELLETSLRRMERDTSRVHPIVAGPWIMNSVLHLN